MALVDMYISDGCKIGIYDDFIIRDKKQIENLLKAAAEKYLIHIKKGIGNASLPVISASSENHA